MSVEVSEEVYEALQEDAAALQRLIDDGVVTTEQVYGDNNQDDEQN